MPASRPPGPPGSRLLGNLPAYEADRLGFLQAAKRDYGPIVAFDRRTTMLLGPAAARTALMDRESAFTVPLNFLQQGLESHDLEAAWQTRTLTNPAYRLTPTAAVASVAADLVGEQLGRLPDGIPIDPLPLLERATSRAVARYFFGDDGDDLPAATAQLLDALAAVIGNPFAVAGQAITPARRRIIRRHRDLRRVVNGLIVQRSQQPERHHDLVSTVLRTTASSVSHEQLSRWVTAALLAGHRVPAAAAAWMLYCLSQQPELQTQLALDGRRLSTASAEGTRTERRSTTLSSAVVLETLRLYPPTWMTERTASRPIRVGEFEFPAGHHFLISPYVLHRDETEWHSADLFVPGRWTGSERPAGTFVPFGLGRRSCPGRELATAVLTAIALRVTEEWLVADRSPMPVTLDPRTTLLPRGLVLAFEPRRQPSEHEQTRETLAAGLIRAAI